MGRCRRRSCLCYSCIRCGEGCGCAVCQGKKEYCSQYAGHEQMRLFTEVGNECQAAPRYPWSHYGLDDKGYRMGLRKMAESGTCPDLVRKAAYQTDMGIAEYIIKAVTRKKSWDYMEHDLELGRISVGRSNFYGFVRRFYFLFDKELKKNEIQVIAGSPGHGKGDLDES